PDPCEPDGGRTAPPGPRRDIRDRAARRGTRRPVASRGPLHRPSGGRPPRDGPVQTEPDVCLRTRHRDLPAPVASHVRWVSVIPLVRRPRRVSKALRGRGLLPVAVRVVRAYPG